MKILKLIFFFLLSLLIFSGCLKVNTKVIFNKDGSGTIEETVLMSAEVVAMMNEFMSSFQDSADTPEEFKLYKEDELMGKATGYGEGVEYVSGEEIELEGWNGYKANYAFDDINKIEIETDPNSKIESGTLTNAEHFSFKFTPGSVSELIIERPEITPDDIEVNTEGDNLDTELDDHFINLLEGMEVNMELEFIDGIVETNAEYVDGKKVTLFNIVFGELLKNKESLELLKTNPPENLDDMKEFIQNAPGIKIDLQRPIYVKF